jgi:hypothetical protein
MKTKILLPGLVLLIWAGLGTSLHSQPAVPTFHEGVKIQYKGNDLRSVYSTGYNYYSVPCVADWNSDGKKDLLVGYFYEGWVYLYINSGTDSDPVFESEEILTADGSTISVGYG